VKLLGGGHLEDLERYARTSLRSRKFGCEMGCHIVTFGLIPGQRSLDSLFLHRTERVQSVATL
jgi:hypothetical protein